MLLSAEMLWSQGDLMIEVAEGGVKLDVVLDVALDVEDDVGGVAEHAFIVTVTTSSIVVVSWGIGSLFSL
jgi:hypothetical protein